MEKAIQVYQSTPKKYRSQLGIEEKLPQLKLQLNKTGKRAADEMKSICTSPVDITEMVNDSQKLIQGKNLTETLKILANLYPGATKTKIRSSAEQSLAQFHFSSFFGLTTRARDGRVVTKSPGMAVAPRICGDRPIFNIRKLVCFIFPSWIRG